jgi:hypothetical protein
LNEAEAHQDYYIWNFIWGLAQESDGSNACRWWLVISHACIPAVQGCAEQQVQCASASDYDGLGLQLRASRVPQPLWACQTRHVNGKPRHMTPLHAEHSPGIAGWCRSVARDYAALVCALIASAARSSDSSPLARCLSGVRALCGGRPASALSPRSLRYSFITLASRGRAGLPMVQAAAH